MVHERTSDVSTFPIECTLEKHAQGFYILSGVCHVCGKTFRATGCIYRAKLSPWAHHKRLQHLIIKHAQTHGAFGYRPQRNLHQMRLDWVLSACNSSVQLDGGVYATEDTGKLVPSKYKADMESARDQQPKSQQHVLGKSDDDEAVHVTVQSAVTGGLNVPYPSIKHQNTADISTFTFPIACALEKHARGFYILTGVCRLCDKTFRASGGIYQGKAQPWSTHSRLQQQIMKHARTHSAVGYTPHRNLDKMRLDWVQLPSKSSASMADASASRNREVTTFRASDSIYRGKTQPWSTHTRLEHKIIEHARTHGTAGYTPQRNLHEMRLDWVRSQRKRCGNTEAMESEESAASSLRGVPRAQDISKLVPSRLREGQESAKKPWPNSPKHIPGKSDDVGAAHVTAQHAATGGSNVPNSSREHEK